MKLKTVLRSAVRHPKKIPLWLRRMDLVKAEMKTVRFPRTAREGFRQCVELSENVRRWFWESIRADHPEASEEEIENERRLFTSPLLCRSSAPDSEMEERARPIF
jgi:hypothetical protein